MNTIQQYIRLILNEGKVDDLRAKYTPLFVDLYKTTDCWKLHGLTSTSSSNSDPKVLANEIVTFLLAKDPSPTHKFSEWLLKTELNNGIENKVFSSLNDIAPTLEYFFNNTERFEKRDINQYKNIKDLEREVKRVSSQTSKRQKRQQLKGNVEKLYEDDEFLLIRPDDKDAVMAYGKGTQWCITMANTGYYDEYIDDNVVFYFLISKTLERMKFNDELEEDEPIQEYDLSKVAFVIRRDDDNSIEGVEIFDAQDAQFDESVLDEGSPTKDAHFWLSKIKSDAVKQPKCFMSKIRSGEKVADNVLSAYWEINFMHNGQSILSGPKTNTNAISFLGDLSIYQQRIIGKIDKNVQKYLENGEFCTTTLSFVSIYQRLMKRVKDENLFAWKTSKNIKKYDLCIENLKTGEIHNVIKKEKSKNRPNFTNIYVDEHNQEYIDLNLNEAESILGYDYSLMDV